MRGGGFRGNLTMVSATLPPRTGVPTLGAKLVPISKPVRIQQHFAALHLLVVPEVQLLVALEPRLLLELAEVGAGGFCAGAGVPVDAFPTPRCNECLRVGRCKHVPDGAVGDSPAKQQKGTGQENAGWDPSSLPNVASKSVLTKRPTSTG